MAKDKDRIETSTERNAEAGKDKLANQQDTQNGLKEPLVTNTPDQDKTMVDSNDQKANEALKKEIDKKVSAQDEREALNKELYETLKSGEDYPGYTIVPADRASENPTVEKVISVHGSDAVVKIKGSARKSFTESQLGRNLGLIEGKQAKEIEEGRA